MNNKTKQMNVKYSMHALLQVLKGTDEQNPLPKQDALRGVEACLKKEGLLQEHDYTRNNSGEIRWEINLQFYFTNLQKGNFADRKRGQWWITEEGKELANKDPDTVYQRAKVCYDESIRAKHLSTSDNINEGEVESSEDAYDSLGTLDDAQGKALRGIQERLKKIDAYEFQNLVADILTATGWTVHHVAPPGPDGGVDITATTDALGMQQPRLRVQVKHQLVSGQKISAPDIQKLRGAIDQQTDTGMLVSSSGFTKEATKDSCVKPQIKLVDLPALLKLLEQYYDKLPPRGRQLLPLKKVYFFSGSDDE